jgi:hypothetical protein
MVKKTNNMPTMPRKQKTYTTTTIPKTKNILL